MRVLDTCYAWRVDRPIVKTPDDLEFDFWPFIQHPTTLEDFFDNLIPIREPATREGWKRIFWIARRLEAGLSVDTERGVLFRRFRGAAA
jgi:hypothetical protein